MPKFKKGDRIICTSDTAFWRSVMFSRVVSIVVNYSIHNEHHMQVRIEKIAPNIENKALKKIYEKYIGDYFYVDEEYFVKFFGDWD